jgi:amidophosphoribosyltransferase
VELLKERGLRHVLRETYDACVAELKKPRQEMRNAVKAIYAPFSEEEIAAKIAQLVYPSRTPWRGEVKVIFQTVAGLHAALDTEGGPSFGDWYFTGDYPTPGGYAVVNRAFMNFYDKKEGRAYDTLL